jgi:hypothetical protein
LDDALFKDINRVDVFLQSAKYSAGLQKVTTRLVMFRSVKHFCGSFTRRFKKMSIRHVAILSKDDLRIKKKTTPAPP